VLELPQAVLRAMMKIAMNDLVVLRFMV